VSNNGCCYSEAAADIVSNMEDPSNMAFGPCHSCSLHESGWCAVFGVIPFSETPVDDCISQSGCTWDSENEVCLSAEPERIIEELTCADVANDGAAIDAFKACFARTNDIKECKESYFYQPACDGSDETKYQPAQEDLAGQQFCVDENGHEIPNTRRQIAGNDLATYQNEGLDTYQMLFREGVDCKKRIAKAAGKQCPNAIMLTTKGGAVILNEDHKPNCDVTCHTDKDCGEPEWCCFNGCGYACKKPVLPLQGCAAVPHNHDGQTILQADQTLAYDADAVHDHEMTITLACEGGWDAMPLDGPQTKDLTCKHGNWEYCVDDICTDDFHLPCQAQCGIFNVPNAKHQHHYSIEGSGQSYGHTRRISCPNGYGVVGGSDEVKANGYEEVVCTAGRQWLTQQAAFAHKHLPQVKESLETLSADSDQRQALELEKAQYEAQLVGNNEATIRCDVCFDDAEWRDDDGNSCLYYQARPLECKLPDGADPELVDNTARDKCRVSCGTCILAENKYKIREKKTRLDDNNDPANWVYKSSKEKAMKTRTRVRQITVTVTKQYPVTEVCAQGDDKIHATFSEVDGTFVCPEGYTLMG
jgi:hypothetical protein